MTDLEMTKLCADAMGLELLARDENLPSSCSWNGLMIPRGKSYLFTSSGAYSPLDDDAQAMALVKKFELDVDGPYWGAQHNQWRVWERPSLPYASRRHADSIDLNRAIVECVSKIQEGKVCD